jgi:homospermidine synthase
MRVWLRVGLPVQRLLLAGIEADALQNARVLEVARPYLGELAGAYNCWPHIVDRDASSPEDMDHAAPWQLSNFRMLWGAT